MNTTIVKEKINEMLDSFTQKSSAPVNNELIYAEGKNKEGFEKLMIRMGKSEEELHRIIAALNTSL
ncbi:MAG: general stress protein CsbD [Lentimicrobium sp.]|nr:general stress protein CsbD [Lentimicrobium sp.]